MSAARVTALLLRRFFDESSEALFHPAAAALFKETAAVYNGEPAHSDVNP